MTRTSIDVPDAEFFTSASPFIVTHNGQGTGSAINYFIQQGPIKAKFVFAHMRAAHVYAQLSYCVRRKVGALVVKNGTPIAIGYNGMPSGEPNVCELEDGTTDPRVRHAEINALRKLVRSSETSVGAVMFVTTLPCANCAIEIAEAGISAVYYAENYHELSSIQALKARGVQVYQVDTEKETITCP